MGSGASGRILELWPSSVVLGGSEIVDDNLYCLLRERWTVETSHDVKERTRELRGLARLHVGVGGGRHR